MLEIKSITKSFGELNVLSNASMQIGTQEIVALTGASGSGKSTIAKILCSIIKPDLGEVLFEGKKIISVDGYIKELYKYIQLIPQSPTLSLDPMQSVEFAIAEQLHIHQKIKDKKELLIKTHALMERVGLSSSLAKRKPSAISGGEAQRVVIARALTIEPKILIADESTSMLDIATQAEIIALFRQLVKDNGMSLIFVSHDIDLVNAVSDKIYTINQKQIYLTK